MAFYSPWAEDLPRACKAVLAFITEKAGKKRKAWPSVKTIATGTGYSERTVQYAMRHLERVGLIDTQSRYRQNGSQSSNLYILHRGVQETAPPETLHLNPVVVQSTSQIIDKVKAVAGVGISKEFAAVIRSKYTVEQLDQALAEMARQIANGTAIKNVGGWLRVALASGYRPSQARAGKNLAARKAIKADRLTDKEREILRKLG